VSLAQYRSIFGATVASLALVSTTFAATAPQHATASSGRSIILLPVGQPSPRLQTAAAGRYPAARPAVANRNHLTAIPWPAARGRKAGGSGPWRPQAVIPAGPAGSPLEAALLQRGRATGPSGAAAPPGSWPMIILAAYDAPETSRHARPVEFDEEAFRPDPTYQDKPYDPAAQVNIYGGKREVNSQRPVVELGTPLYEVGPLGQGTNFVGEKNLIFGHLYAFGDWRTAVAYNDNGDNEVAQIATRANIDVDLGLTATERIHALFQPLQDDGQFTRCEFAGEESIDDCELEYDFEPQTLFFEGDLGAIKAGVTGSYSDWDLPFTGGFVPLLFQNGVWMEDAFIGGAASLPALNSKALDISNADITVFAGFDKVTAPGVLDAQQNVADSNVNIYGFATFLETLEGYVEAGYAYIDAEDALDGQDYHSATLAFTRRYGGWLSNSIRVVGSFGQDLDGTVNNVEDQNGVMLLAENSFVTSKPYTFLPYANFFVGIERPVPAADETGILKNTGINFESDALTGFPFLNDTGQNAYGGAVGVQYLFDLDQQLVLEVALERDLEDFSNSFDEVVGDQYAAGIRYQIPLSKAWLLRADAIYALKEGEADAAGARTELRWKF
jgi:hypothetical protein